MADSDLSRRALLARAAILDPGVDVARALVRANLPRKRNWSNLLAHYRHTRKLAMQLSDDEEMFEHALDINSEASDALLKLPAPSLTDVAIKLRIIIADNSLGDTLDTVLADLDRMAG